MKYYLSFDEKGNPRERFSINENGEGKPDNIEIYEVSEYDWINKSVKLENGQVVNDPVKIKNKRINEIKSRLSAIDKEVIRPLRAIINNTGTEFDANKVSTLETEAATLREELATLI